MEIITSHVHLDLDGFASMLLAKKLFPNATLVLSGDVGENLKELINFYKEIFNIYKASEIKLNKVTKIIIVDTSSFSRLGKFAPLADNKNIEIEIFDHHQINSDVNQNFGANSSLLLKKIFEKDIFLTPLEASIALMGIYEDTGNFTFKNTTYHDMEMGAKLLQLGANLDNVMHYVNKSLNQNDLDIMLELIKNGEILEINHHRIFIITFDTKEYRNGLDVLINKIMEIEGSEACFIVYGNKQKSSIIGRSTTNKIPINRILDIYGEGGHCFASSCIVKNEDLKDIKLKIIDSLKNKIDIGKIAKEIMKAPVKTVEPNSKLKDVLKLITRFGFSGLPVVEGGVLLGIISRRDVEKAVSHGFGNGPIKSYMTKNVITAGLSTSLESIKKLMVENEISRIPIVSEDKLLGIVTRSDLLLGLYSETINKSITSNNEIEFNFDYLEKLPVKYKNILKEIENVSKLRNENVYLVGGIVRDLLLGIENLDMDLVIEGDAISFGNELKTSTEVSKIVNHESFGTCVIILKNGLKIDLASSRIEYYEYPTSLPSVDIGNIKDDLYRRDFTINAMAIKLNFGKPGKIIDYYGGFKNLKEKKIKFLHNLSFVEDPTRIIRAIRFAVRYGFTFEEETFNFMKQAINQGFLSNLSWQRFKNEILIMLNEKSIIKALDYFLELKIMDKIHPNIKIDENIKSHLIEIEKKQFFFEKYAIDTKIVYLLIILENLNKNELDFIFKRFTFNKEFIKNYDYGKSNRKSIAESLYNIQKNSEIYSCLHYIPKEIIALLYIEDIQIQDKIILYFEKIAKLEPLVKGNNLIALGIKPSKDFKLYLSELFLLQLDNELLDKTNLITKWKHTKGEIFNDLSSEKQNKF